MKNVCSNKAVTLMEVIVTTIIISFMIFGIFSAQTALQNSSQNYGIGYSVSSSTVNALNHILNNASGAIGIGSDPNTKGILTVGDVGASASNPTFCIHKDDQDDLKTTNDNWYCYTQNGTNINFCTVGYAAGTLPLRGAGAVSCSASSKIIGTAVAGTISASNPSFVPISTLGAQSLVFSISITNRLNPAQAKDNSSNPEVTKSGSVSPANYSM